MEKRAPKLKILVFPQSEIDRVAGAGAGSSFAVQDIFSGYLVQQQGEGAGATDDTVFDALQWRGQRAFDSIDNTLEFVRFMKDGTVIRGVPGIAANEGMGGWTLRPKVAPVNCKALPPRENDPQPDNDFETIEWRAKKGDDWESYVPAEEPYKTFVRHRSQQPDKAIEIVSSVLDRPAGVEVELIWDGVFVGHTQAPGVRLTLIDKRLSLVWRRYGKASGGKATSKPTVERWRNTETGSGWEVWKRLDDAAPVTFEGRSLVRLSVVGGCWLLELDGRGYFLMETSQLPQVIFTDAGGNVIGDPPRAVPAAWPRAAMRLSVYGVDVALGASTLSYEDDNGERLAGALVRTVPCPHGLSSDAPTEAEGVTGGHKAPGTDAAVYGVRGANSVTYSVALVADKKLRSSPFVSNVLINFPGGTGREEAEPIDLRPGALSVKYSSGEPELLPTSEVQIELSRRLLDEFVPGWADYVHPFAPIRLLATWDYEDGAAIVTGDWTRVFEGYIITPDKALEDYNAQNMTIVARDPSVRLKAPSGFVDERYAPLDFLFWQQGGAPLYDGDAVKYLLETELGARLANTINGNGDALAFSANQFPLLSVETDRVGYFTIQAISGTATQNGFNLPPPFGSDVYGWIHDTIAKANTAVFYWGYSPLAAVDDDEHSFGTRPLVPIYGRINQIMTALGATPKTLPDAIYLDGDANDLIASVSVETLTDKLFNEVIVWGEKPDGVAASLFPSVFTGRARLPPSDANSAENSWRRVLSEQQEFVGKIAGSDYAQALAITILQQFEGVVPRNVTIVMPRGDESLHWGMKVKPKMVASGSDLTIGVSDEEFRVKRITHTWDLTGQNPERAFVTEIIARPLSTAGF